MLRVTDADFYWDSANDRSCDFCGRGFSPDLDEGSVQKDCDDGVEHCICNECLLVVAGGKAGKTVP